MFRGKVYIQGRGSAWHLGHFDDEDAAADRVDAALTELGTPEKRNRHPDGTLTGYDGRAAGWANVTASNATRRQSTYEGVSQDPDVNRAKRWYCRVQVPECKLKEKACPKAATGCKCKKIDQKSTRYATEKEAAMARDKYVRTYQLGYPLHFPDEFL